MRHAVLTVRDERWGEWRPAQQSAAALDLVCGDEFTGPLGQPQGGGDDEEVSGDVEQRLVCHLLFGTVNEVATTFLGQWAIPLSSKACADPGTVDRTQLNLRVSGMGDRFNFTREWLCGVQLAGGA